METLSPAPAGVTAPAPVETSFGRETTSVPSPEISIHSPSEFTPSFHVDSFNPEDLGSVFAGQTLAEKIIDTPDEFSETIAPGSLPTPEEAIYAVESLLGLIDEEQTDESLPSPHLILREVESSLEDAYQLYVQDIPETLSIESEQLDSPIQPYESFTGKIDSLISPAYRLETDHQADLSPAPDKVEISIVSEFIETKPQEEVHPQLLEATRIIEVDKGHAAETIHLLEKVGVKNAPEIVAQAMTQNLEKEGIQACITIQTQPAITSKPEESAHELQFGLELKDDRKKTQKVFIVDEVAQIAQIQALENAVESAFKENGEVSGKDVLSEFTKKEEQKSEPLKGSLLDDGALGETTQAIYHFPETSDKEMLKENITEALTSRPPIKEDVQGRSVSETDIDRVFNRTPVLDSSSITKKPKPRKPGAYNSIVEFKIGK